LPHRRFFSFIDKYKHENVENKIEKPKLTLGQRAADAVSAFVGSWKFIIITCSVILVWILANIYFMFVQWDPYPFILLNLTLSTLAALHTPIILMSQNRQAEIDRIRAEYDYKVNIKAEKEIKDMQKDLEQIKIMIKDLHSNIKKK
jgi:uncharacterized membrane protein